MIAIYASRGWRTTPSMATARPASHSQTASSAAQRTPFRCGAGRAGGGGRGYAPYLQRTPCACPFRGAWPCPGSASALMRHTALPAITLAPLSAWCAKPGTSLTWASSTARCRPAGWAAWRPPPRTAALRGEGAFAWRKRTSRGRNVAGPAAAEVAAERQCARDPCSCARPVAACRQGITAGLLPCVTHARQLTRARPLPSRFALTTAPMASRFSRPAAAACGAYRRAATGAPRPPTSASSVPGGRAWSAASASPAPSCPRASCATHGMATRCADPERCSSGSGRGQCLGGSCRAEGPGLRWRYC